MDKLKYAFLILSGVVCFCTEVGAQVELEVVKVTKEISMKVPESFKPMDQADLINKYVSSRTPLAMYTSDDRQVDLGINQNSSFWGGDDLEIVQSFYKSAILNLFTEVNFIQEEIREVNGRAFVIFEFVSKVTDEESTFGGTTSISKYNFIQYTLYDGKVLLFNFSSPSRQRAKWQEPVREMMASVKIK